MRVVGYNESLDLVIAETAKHPLTLQKAFSRTFSDPKNMNTNQDKIIVFQDKK